MWLVLPSAASSSAEGASLVFEVESKYLIRQKLQFGQTTDLESYTYSDFTGAVPTGYGFVDPGMVWLKGRYYGCFAL